MKKSTYASIILKKILRLAGKTYNPDPKIPAGLLFNEISTRSLMMLRGFCFFYKLVFLGKNVKIRGKKLIKIGSKATIEDNVYLDAYAENGIQIGSLSRIGTGTIIRSTAHLSVLGKGLRIGHNSGIGEYGYMGCAGGIDIGDDVIMGQFVSFHAQEHQYSNPDIPIRLQGVIQKGIKVGSNTWVGSRVTFLDDTKIGANSIIAAGAVVKGHFPEGAIIGGVPAKTLKFRPGYH